MQALGKAYSYAVSLCIECIKGTDYTTTCYYCSLVLLLKNLHTFTTHVDIIFCENECDKNFIKRASCT